VTSEAAHHLGERVVTHLSEQKEDDVYGTVSVSIGIAVFDTAVTPYRTLEELTRAADQALYAAKTSGKNRIRAA
jgi:diguanylate cyclase (GGDEF)-like protein